MASRRRRVAIVPHTHWDREWYAPYQTFRMKLVDTLDEFLPHLERDPSYTRFLLDGQMAVVDDYLEVRPEAAATIRRLAVSGRLDMGPWYALMDEFLVSGETIVRDLQMGLERAAEFGGAMDVGYLPDMFGHIAQMPQLLALAGIHHAVVWRGVPAAIDRSAFWWEAPDGTRVRAEYLLQGYGNGEGIPDDAKALVARVARFEEDHATYLTADDGILWMNGTDHQAPQLWLGRVVAEANDVQDDYELSITSLAEYLVDASTDALPEWRGELRSGARANLLMGVASNRVDVKQAAARAERELERRAEPLAALFLPPEGPAGWPAALLHLAWRDVVRNAAHDSVCACSVDEVVDAVLHRYAEARQIGEGVADRALDALAADMATEGWVVVNPSARTRAGLVELDVPGTGPLPGAQVLREGDAVVADYTLTLDEARAMLPLLRTQQLGHDLYVNDVDVEETDDAVEVTLHVNRRLLTNFLVSEVAADVLARLEARPGAVMRARAVQDPYRRILASVRNVPGLGWRMLGDVEPPRGDFPDVSVDPADGTFSIGGLRGFDRLVDGGDVGDTYNYSPPDDDVVVDRPDRVEVVELEDGPLRRRLRIDRAFPWADVTTVLELRVGEPFVRVTTSFVNTRRDHRVRAHFPLPAPATASEAECAFAVVTRGLEAEGGPTERALATFPSRRFVRAGGLTLVHEGLLEYELVDGGGALALTLLRATGMLSRVDVAYRPLPAGPPIPMDGPQMLGPVEVRYAASVDPDVDPYAMVDDVFLPLEVRPTKGRGTRPDRGAGLSVTGAEVTAVRRRPGGLEVRVCNPWGRAATVTVDRTGWVVDLRGAPVRPFDGAADLRPFEILTVLLDEPDP